MPADANHSDSGAAAETSASQSPLATIGFRALRLHQNADRASEILIYAMAVFSPWAFGCANSDVLWNWTIFGSTETWTVWTMNFAGYLLGALLLVKIFIRRRTGYQPPRWTTGPAGEKKFPATLANAAVPALAAVTAAIVLYCLVSALNARANYRPDLFGFEYRKSSVAWLPHSYDGTSSWIAFWNYLALALAFWAVCDWLPGKTPAELRAERRPAAAGFGRVALLPERLRRLLWVLSVNGALLGVEGIAQRLAGTNKLLWLMPTRVNNVAADQFGPYAYRSNAAQYFNLLWPAALGFWWTLRRSAQLTAARTDGPRTRAHHLLLPCVLVMAVCPIISFSRGGAIIAVVSLAAAALILFAALKRAHGATKFGLFAFGLAILCLGFAIGGETLGDRMKEFDAGLMLREKMYAVAHTMAEEHPLFGSGPGTFNMLFQFYRSSVTEYWPAQLHNDWLETRITFGWLGSALIAAAFLLVAARRWLPGGIQTGWRFPALIGLGVAGCLAHARWDFPFQMYSIVFLFLLLCAILFNLSRRAGRPD